MTPMTCVVIGNESLLVQCCEKLLERGHAIAAVVTRNPEIALWAQGRDLRSVAPGPGLARRLPDAPFDWLLSIANLDILPADVLSRPVRGAVNFHDGPLPRHAGLNAPLWALIEGETRHGITWHMISGGVDEGDVLTRRGFDIADTDTALTLNAKCFEAAIDSFGELIDQLETGNPQRCPQDPSQRRLHALADRPAHGGCLDFTRPARELERLVRALDHGRYWNPLCTAKIWIDGRFWHVGAAQTGTETGAPGTVLAVTSDRLTLACGTGSLILSDLRHRDGTPADPAQVCAVGDLAGLPETGDLRAVAQNDRFWRAGLADLLPVELAGAATTDAPARPQSLRLSGVSAEVVAIWAARQGDSVGCAIAYADAALSDLSRSGLVLPWVPVRLPGAATVTDFREGLTQAIDGVKRRAGIAADLPLRDPALGWPATPDIGLSEGGGMIAGTVVTIAPDTGLLWFDAARLAPDHAALVAARLEFLAAQLCSDTDLATLSLLPEAERDLVLNRWNVTDTEVAPQTMHRLFEAQVARTPEAPALVFEGTTLSYAQLNARANRAAHVLMQMGVTPDTVVGLCCRRSIDLMVAALAILKAGGAYLPMDPSYPADRLAHFIADSGAPVIVTQSALVAQLPPQDAQHLLIDRDPRLDTAPETNLPETSTPDHLAYLIYTSGSTGTPKGVMIEHRNVANFYAGMDACVAEPGGTWLAVTSLSFDISVLELFYTTARGFKVVLTSDEDRGLISNGPLPTSGGMEFSLYYWGSDDGPGRDKYRLLLEGSKFGDQNGFCAVWTPERHFHAFGGLYPNPSVTGAAVAAVTRNIGVRGGSCVAPLHHPARIAEEWAVIDNLTGGRAGMAIASGWQPDDFVLRPENTPPENKAAMIESIETVRKLWRGEAVAFPKQDGTLHEVVTQPRPVSRELPVWVTTAGNPDTWKEAGNLGCNVLTHLLGQTVEEVAGKITLYHAALRAAGHDPKDHSVTLMLHSYLAGTREEAKEIAREPMKNYLRSAAGLIKQYAWAFPAFKKPEGVTNPFQLDLGSLEPEEMDGILDFAFERYFNDSGLFGTVEDALERTEALKKIGVTEIACLIDYGIATDTVLEGLKPLAEVLRRANLNRSLPDDDHSIAAQILRHEVTHLQCTPSMARMIAMNDEARFALGRVRHLFLGGEPLPGALVAEFAKLTDASMTNMYGPTETTIWSSVEPAAPQDGVVNIGRPIANTQLYVLDAARNPVAVGTPGELWIGGDGVTRGYWNRDELTAERFLPNPFHSGRMYRTGDLVRRRADGRIDFVGRVDFQIKLRGHRIELGEIEAAMESRSAIRQAVVSAREDTPGDMRLVGYYTSDAPVDETALRAALGQGMPEYMVPQRLMRLDAFPLTPNKKVDRGNLPKPLPAKAAAAPLVKVAETAVPHPAAGKGSPDTEVRIAAIWSDVLGVQGITGRDSFFDLGGHSLLAVQAHRMIRDRLGAAQLSITDIFRFPQLSALAARVATLTAGPETGKAPAAEPAAANDRAASRNDAMARRRAMRARRSA